jgi:hypothetical protein
MEIISLAMNFSGGYRYAGQDYTSDEAAALIEGKAFATLTRDGGIVASDDRDRVASYGAPRSGASLAAALTQ